MRMSGLEIFVIVFAICGICFQVCGICYAIHTLIKWRKHDKETEARREFSEMKRLNMVI